MLGDSIFNMDYSNTVVTLIEQSQVIQKPMH